MASKKEYSFTLDELLRKCDEVVKEYGKHWADGSAATELVAKITGLTYNEVYRMLKS